VALNDEEAVVCRHLLQGSRVCPLTKTGQMCGHQHIPSSGQRCHFLSDKAL